MRSPGLRRLAVAWRALRRAATPRAEFATIPRPLLVAGALAVGSAIGIASLDSNPLAIGPLALLGALATLASLARVGSDRRRVVLILSATLLAGVSNASIRGSIAQRRATIWSLETAAAHGAAPAGRPIALRGRIASPPRMAPPGDRLWRHTPQRLAIDLETVEWVDPTGTRGRLPAGSVVTLRLRGGAAIWREGSAVEATGLLFGPRPSMNPAPWRRVPLSLERPPIGSLLVADPRLVREIDEATLGMGAIRRQIAELETLRRAARRSAAAQLDAMLPVRCVGEPRALLEALLLGDRSGESHRPLRERFAVAGLAHFLAISGFNLAVIAAVAALLARAVGVRPRRQGLAALVAIAAYALLLPAALPVLRAGLMAGLLSLGRCLGRRWDSTAATALAAIVLLIAAPGEVARPGFQLSFAAVLALQRLAPRLRRRWFGPPDPWSASGGAIVRSRLADLLCASVAAWLVSTPIVLCHFGIAATFGVPATILATPLVALCVSIAAVAIPIAFVAPLVGELAGSVLDALARAIVSIAAITEALPLSAAMVQRPSAWWGLAASGSIVAWLWLPAGRPLAAARIASAALLAVPLLPPLDLRTPPLVVEMLAVGDGTAIVLRRGDRAVLVDGGSSSDRSAGRRSVIPALEALGVRRIEAALVSHPHLDHYAGLGEVLERHPARRLFVEASFIDAASAWPDGPAAEFLAAQRRRGVVPSVLSEGDRLRLVGAEIEVLHPPPGGVSGGVNDASLALLVRDLAQGPQARPLLLTCGDLEAAGIGRLVEVLVARGLLDAGGRAPIAIEVPHHGSAIPEAIDLMRALPRSVWMQSSGPSRLIADRIGAAQPWPLRLVTARDGAIRLRSDPSGTVAVETFRGAWRAVLRIPAR